MNRLFFLVLCMPAACTQSAEEQWEAHRRAAGVKLDAWDAATRAAFHRLPPCPAPDTTGLRSEALIETPLRIPKAFQPESTTYMHGGQRFRNGDTVIALVNGHFGWASFTGNYGGGGVLPAGCVARLGGRIYMVSETRDSTSFHASAIAVSDTLQVYGDQLFRITAPHSVRGWLLGLLSVRAPVARFPAPWTHFFVNLHMVAIGFDSSRLTWRGDTAEVWLRSQFDEPLGSPNDSTPAITVMDRHILVHCASRTTREIRRLTRDAAGDSVNGHADHAPRYESYRDNSLKPMLTALCTALPKRLRHR